VLVEQINKVIVQLLNQVGTRAIGVNGAENSLLRVQPKSPELGFVGEVIEINHSCIEEQLQDGLTPVIAGMGVDEAGQMYNVNADASAGMIARELQVEKFILLTNVAGLYETFGEEDSLISEITPGELHQLLASGKLSAGMIPKIEGILLAVDGGVPRAHILDGRVEHSVLLEIFTKEGIGTMVRERQGA